MTQIDIAIVGAGAAGIAAARHLIARGFQVILLEARDRIGGRTHTTTRPFGWPIDLGGHWFHGARGNPLVPLAAAHGIAHDRHDPPARIWHEGGWLDDARVSAIDETVEALLANARALAAGGTDIAMCEAVAVTPQQQLARAILSAETGRGFDSLSSHDLANFATGGGDWRVPGGLGSLIARLGEGVPVHLSTPVTAIDSMGRHLELATPRGTLRAGAAIVTLPTDVLASGAVTFRPALPIAVEQAFHDLPLGHQEKVLVELDGDPLGLGEDGFLTVSRGDTTVFVDYRPAGHAMLTIYLGADLAEKQGPDDRVAYAIGHLTSCFDDELRRRLGRVIATDWRGHRLSRGAYSAARPGRADARAVLAAGVDDRLLFAGEACSAEAYASVHGAWLSGEAAANRCAAAFKP